MTNIQAKIADIDDLQARRISAAENLLREDLSAIESIEATIEIIDVEMGKDPEYLTVGKTPLERVHKLLSKLDSIRVSKDRGSHISKEAEALLHKFVQQVESILKNLPKPLKWPSFLLNDLILLTDIPFNNSSRLCKTQPEQSKGIKSISEQKHLQDLNRHLVEMEKSVCRQFAIIGFGQASFRVCLGNTDTNHQKSYQRIDRKTVYNHLGKMAALPNSLNNELSIGSTIPKVFEKYCSRNLNLMYSSG